MGDGDHDGELAREGEDSAADAAEDLGEGDEGDGGAGGAEGDEKGGAEEEQGNAGVGRPFEISGPTNDSFS